MILLDNFKWFFYFNENVINKFENIRDINMIKNVIYVFENILRILYVILF